MLVILSVFIQKRILISIKEGKSSLAKQQSPSKYNFLAKYMMKGPFNCFLLYLFFSSFYLDSINFAPRGESEGGEGRVNRLDFVYLRTGCMDKYTNS